MTTPTRIDTLSLTGQAEPDCVYADPDVTAAAAGKRTVFTVEIAED